MKTRLDATKEKYDVMNIFGKEVLFSNYRIDRKTVPEDLYVYELRDDCSDGEPYEIAKSIAVDFFGTVLSKEPIELTEDNGNRRYMEDDDWGYDCNTPCITLGEWMKNHD